MSEAENLSKAEKERELRKAKAKAKREETSRKIEGKKHSKKKDEEWDEEYLDCSGRGVGVISAKRRKSTEGQLSTLNANEVGNLGNGKPGKRERWLVDASKAKKVKVGERGDKGCNGSGKRAVADSSDGSKVPFSISLACKVALSLHLIFRCPILLLESLMVERRRRLQ